MTDAEPTGPTHTRILVIGAGPGGIITGHRLRELGIDDFVILERSAGVGGTWWRNRYPGLECDVPSHLYSFSFALKSDWTKPYARQPEILEYMQQCVEDLGLWPHIRLDTSVEAARWDEEQSGWRVRTTGGREYLADALVSSVGMFGDARWPEIEGRESFAGTAFHTSAWPADHSLAGERVAVIGSAASAVQLIPEIARETAELYVFQRSANWVLPKEDTPFTPEQLARLATDRSALEAMRSAILDQMGPSRPFMNEQIRQACEQAGLGNIAVVEDPDVRERLTPTVPWGCQRPLFSNVYYPTFNRPGVELVTDAIVRITPTGVVTADGRERAVDTIVYATGYETTRYASSVEIVGRGDRRLDEAWSDGAQAYLGITTAGFPNLFMLYGPNTNQGSLIFMIECQVEYVLRMLQRMETEGLAWVDIRPEVMAAFNEELQHDLDEVTVWDAGCHQYYRGPSGRIVTQWPKSMYAYRDRTEAPDPADAYDVGRVPMSTATPDRGERS